MTRFLSQLNGRNILPGHIYYSSYDAGWFCKACQEYTDLCDHYWKTNPKTLNHHPGVFFSELENYQRHIRAVISP